MDERGGASDARAPHPAARVDGAGRVVDTVVVGAGIAGLAYAHGLGPDADVLVLEAGDRPGGLIRTGTWEDVHYEWGPEALQDNAPETVALLEELGLERLDADPAARNRYILHGRARGSAAPTAPEEATSDAADAPPPIPGLRLVAVPTGPGAFLRSPLLTPLGKLRASTEPWRAREPGLDGSVADFVRHRLGRQVLERLVDPALSGIYAGDPELVSLRAAFPTLWELVHEHGSILRGMFAKLGAKKAERQRLAEEARARGEAPPPRAERTPVSLLSVRGGLERLPEAIAAALGDRLRLRTPVAAVRAAHPDDPADRAAEGARWVVELGPGDGRETSGAGDSEASRLAARRVVLAAPAGRAAALLADDAPALSRALGSMTSEAVVAVAHVWPRASVARPLDAFGYLVPSRAGISHLGTLFSSSIQPARCPGDRVLLRTLLGGARRPELVEAPDDELLDVVRCEVGGVLGLSGEPLHARVVRWPVALPRYDLEQPARQATIDALLGDRPGLHVVGNHRRGISVNALIEASRALAAEHRGTASVDAARAGADAAGRPGPAHA